ncbi:hypothetical protein R6Q57_001885 [Mikania cordata]
MSGAESSRAAGKRRRGPIPRPRGELGSPAKFQRDERTIRYRPDLMIMGPLTTPIDMRDLRRAGILERDDPPRWAGFVVGPQVMPPKGTAAAEVVMGSVPTQAEAGHPARFPPRQYPLRDPIPDPLTLESLCHWMDGYHDQYRERRMQDQRRQEDAMRYLMTSLHIDIPEFYRAPDEHDGAGGADDDE